MGERGDSHATLLAAFEVDQADLTANRAGLLSDGQRARLRGSAYRNALGGLVLLLGLLAIVVFLADRPASPGTLSVTALLVVGIVTMTYFQVRGIMHAAHSGVVVSHTGPIRIWTQRKTGWWLGVADQTFKLPVHPWKIPDDTAPYHVYVAPAAKRIVAVEPAG